MLLFEFPFVFLVSGKSRESGLCHLGKRTEAQRSSIQLHLRAKIGVKHPDFLLDQLQQGISSLFLVMVM